MEKLKVLDLFSGCGGLSLGFEQTGYDVILAVDSDPECEKTYRKNFPKTPFLRKDITKISNKELDKIFQKQKPDLVIGSPPCQSYSLNNKNRNKKVDKRSLLVHEFIRIVGHLNPEIFLMENVTGMLTITKDFIEEVKESFRKAGRGYNVELYLLNSAQFGVSQLRERVFFVGIRKDLERVPTSPKPILTDPKDFISVWKAISDLPVIESGQGQTFSKYTKNPLSEYQKLIRQDSKGVYNHISMIHTPRLIERFKKIGQGESVKDVPEEFGAVKRGSPNEKSGKIFSQNNLRLLPNKPAPTVAASFQSNFIHPFSNRNITAREGARLQSFPDNFVFEGKRTKMSWEKGLSQYQQIGNAVPPLLAKYIAMHLKTFYDKKIEAKKNEIRKVVPTDSLKVYSENEKLFENLPKVDYLALKEDIRKNGIKTELHITKNNVILCGHQRWKIAKELLLKTVPIKVVDIEESNKSVIQEYVILDNLLRRHLSVEEKAKLDYELYKLHDSKKGLRTDLGRNPTKVDVFQEIANKTGQKRTTIVEHIQYAKAIEKEPKLKERKLSEVLAFERKKKYLESVKKEVKNISAKEWGIYEGDCLKELDKIKDKSIACVIIDPPYGIDYQSKYRLVKHDKIENDNHKALDLLDNSLKKVQSKMKDNSHIYIFTIWPIIDKVKPIIEKYFNVKTCIVWNKLTSGVGDVQGSYAEYYEMIIFASKGKRKLLGTKRPLNILEFSRTTNKNHPCEKPVELLKELIKNSTVEGEIILDYFAGSGSTLIASIETNRKGIAIEISKDNVDIIKKRVNDLKK